MPPHVFVIAVENSGDQLGAALISDLRDMSPDITLSGIGGAAMAAQGVRSDIDISALSILGFVEALKVYALVLQRVRQTVAAVTAARPDAVVLIDSWGFMIRVAQGLKRAGYQGQIIKYVAPQVWAMREGRANILTASVDHLLTIHSFDAPYFTQHGLPVTYVGNPVFDTDYRAGQADAFRQRHKIATDRPIIGVMFGSRQNEISRLAGTLAEAAAALAREHNAVVVSPVAETVKDAVTARAQTSTAAASIVTVPQSDMIDAMAAMDVALACSGTVTTQLADAGVPSVVAYKLSPLTYIAGKYLFKPDYISIVNIAANTALMPELVQQAATVEGLVKAATPFLRDPDLRAARSRSLRAQTDVMKGKGGRASERAAFKILELISV